MSETASPDPRPERSQTTGVTALEIPSRNLPPVTYRDLPEPLPLWRIMGPGVVLAASGIGSGEFVLWPFVAQRTGLVFMWAALFGSLLMFFIATECARYTLATGETIITGFTRVWKPWWVGFILMAALPNLWPGYATGTGTLTTFILGGGSELVITVLALVAIALGLLLAPVVYELLERAQLAMMAVMLAFIVVAVVVVLRIQAGAFGDFIAGFGEVGQIPSGIEFPVLAGAVAFAGTGGTGVLFVSNYIRDKNLGMGRYIPRIVSPITGREEPGSNLGFFFPQTEENLRRWRGWWRVANWDQFLTFFLFTILTIFLMSMLAYATVFGQEVGEGFDFIRAEGEVLAEQIGPWLKHLFWFTGIAALFSTNLGAWDSVGRVTADSVKANWLRESRFWTESKIYAVTIVVLFVFSVGVLASGLQQPLVLLTIASVLSGVSSFVYCALIIQLNRGVLPPAIRMGGGRVAVFGVAVVFYGFFAVVTILDVVFGAFD